MEREISSGAMLGIVLLALAAVIGLGFGVFAITKGVANEGTVNVQDSLGAVSTQIFLDYDQKIVTGTQVNSALKQFEGKPYAVLIGTRALQQADAKIAVGHKAYSVKSDKAVKYLNYNALLSKDTAGTKPDTVSTDTAGDKVGTPVTTVTLTSGTYIFSNGFASTNGTIEHDKVTGGVFKTGNAEFVPTSVKFQANLIKDPSGNILGVVFEQQ